MMQKNEEQIKHPLSDIFLFVFVLSPQNKRFKKVEEEFRPFNKGKFRIQHFIEIQITQLKEIIAPSYFYYPTTEEEDQIKASKRTYLEGLPQELS